MRAMRQSAVEHGAGMRVREALVRHFGIALSSVKEKLVYRFDFFLSLVTSLISMVLLVYLWRAIYANSTSLGYTREGLLTYVCLGQAFNFARIGGAQRRLLFRVNGSLRTGNIVFDLLRPTDYQAMQFSEVAGQFVAEMLLINLPAYVFALVIFGIAPPASAGAAAGFALSLLGAFLVSFSLDFLLMILAFWTFAVQGIIYARRAAIELLAGSIIPLSLFPDWLRTIALVLPFQGLAYTPISIYLGDIRGAAIWWSFLVQLGWAVALAVLTRLVWLRALRRLVVQGG
jgi:viologen exporter family transport system permease protein